MTKRGRPRKFTLSKDGKMRCTIFVPVRLLKEDLDLVQSYIDSKVAWNSLPDLFSYESNLAIEDLIYRIENGDLI